MGSDLGKDKNKIVWPGAIWQETKIWSPDLQVISFSSCIFFPNLFLCVICTLKNVSWRSLLAFLACCCCITNYCRFNYGHGAQTFQAAICLC